MNEVEVCNLALSRIGQGASKPIQSIDGTDTSEAAKACARVFASTMQQVLRANVDWPFARKARALELVTQVVPGWDYVYAYPSDCLRVQALSDINTDPFRGNGPKERIPFKLMAATSGESVVIATDLQDAWIWYTRDVTNPAFGDVLFQGTLAWAVAMEISLGLKADPKMWQAASEGFRATLSDAKAGVGNEEVGDAMPDSDTIRAYA